MNEEDKRIQEEHKRRATILDNAELPNPKEYLNDIHEEEKTERTFSDIRSAAASTAL